MPHVVVTSILALTFSAGCGAFGKADDSRSGFHDVKVSWHIRNVDGTLVSSCPPGFTTVFAYLYRLSNAEPPDSLIKTPCTPEGVLTQRLPTAGELLDEPTRGREPQAYFDYSPHKDLYVHVAEDTGLRTAAVSPVYHVEALTSDLSVDFDLYPAGAVALANWSFQSGLTGATLTCSTAGVDQVEVAVRRFSNDTEPLVTVGTWPCDQKDPYFYYDPRNGFPFIDPDNNHLGSGHTRALAPETYFVEKRAKRNGVVVGRYETQVTIEAGTKAGVVQAGSVTITDR